MAAQDFRKRRRGGSEPATEFSQTLREINSLIGAGDFEEALSSLATLSSGVSSPGARAKIAALTAETQFELGRFGEAERYFRGARELAQSDTSDHKFWHKPALGEIRALLKDLQLESAYSRAKEIREFALTKYAEFEKSLALTTEQVATAGYVQIPARPPRPAVVLTRLGKTFLDEGYLDAAREFLNEAVTITPRGASRARQALARIVLAEEKAAQAEQYARESIQFGEFQAKTIASWPLLMAARKKQDKPVLDEAILSELMQGPPSSVRARTIKLIAVSLRRYDDARWRDVVQQWLSQHKTEDKVIASELEKLVLAEEKLKAEAPRRVADLSRDLLSDAMTTPREAVSFAKTFVRFSLETGENPDVEGIAASINSSFGAEMRNRAVHAMALGAMLARKHDIARTLLEQQVATLTPGSPQWGKDHWALARMEMLLKNFASAAEHFLTVASEQGTPERFRVQGFLQWFRALSRAEQPPPVEQVRGRVQAVLDQIKDYQLLLDAGRQLALAGAAMAEIADHIISLAEKKALEEFDKAEHPLDALVILFNLARRQFYDFAHARKMLSFYESLGKTKLEWLWSLDARYWEYLGLIFEAYHIQGKNDVAEALARENLDDATMPVIGLVHIGIPYANWLIAQRRKSEAFALYDRVIAGHPTHCLSAYAYYWKALEAFDRADNTQVQEQAHKLRRCLGARPGLHWQWALDARAICLARETGNAAEIASHRYKPDYVERQREALEKDHELLR